MPFSSLISLLIKTGGSPIDVTHFIGDRVGASYAIAHFIMSIVDWLLGVFGLEKNQTLVMVTHDNYLAGFADLILRIKDGKIIEIEDRRGMDMPEEIQAKE